MGGTTDYQQLLTDEARRAHIHALFGHRFTMQGKLQLPQLAAYNRLGTAEGLSELGTQICRWLGLKPNGLHIQFADKYSPAGYSIDIKAKQILVDAGYRKHPYSCGAVLALALTAYAITKASKEEPDQDLTELATIELGIGLWIVNALAPKISRYRQVYHLIDSSWHGKETVSLSAFSNAQYIEAVVQYAHENRIAADEYLPHIPKRSQLLIPEFTRKQSSRYLPETRMAHQHKKAARIFWIKVGLASLVIASGLSLAIYAASINTAQSDPRIQEQLRTIETLRTQYTDCQSEASKQQSDYDPNDLFLTRQVDATKARCESLRNQYNYAIDQYHHYIDL